jgi:hypothetical protein
MSHSLCVMGMYDEVKVTVPMIVRYVHNDKIRKKNVTVGVSLLQRCYCQAVGARLCRSVGVCLLLPPVLSLMCLRLPHMLLLAR